MKNYGIMHRMNLAYQLRKMRLFFNRNQSLIIRILICWTLGIFAFIADETRQFDTRLDIRGLQKYDSNIVILKLKKSDFKKSIDPSTEKFFRMNEFTEFNDSFYWDQNTWYELLQYLLESDVKNILVTLFFGENIGSPVFKTEELLVLKNPKVIWSASKNFFDKNSMPALSLPDRSNVGSLDFVKDEDGILRRIFTKTEEVPNIVEKMNQKRFALRDESLILNFLGKNIYPVFSMAEVMKDESLRSYLRNKVVIIGTDSPNSLLLTPVGALSKAEVTAHLADNALNERWIRFFPSEVYFIYLLFLVVFTISVMLRYPPQISILIVILEMALVTGLSTAIFDITYYWLPSASAVATLILTWIVFIGHQSMRMEEINAKLRMEQKSREELEQLKNNFVSLISHDLKTPIAKIQAVIDRLLGEDNIPFKSDLASLRTYNEELNRYIQSIIKVLRVESQDFRLHKEVSDLNELIEKALQILKPLAAAKNIQLHIDLEPMFSQELDVTLIQEVIINLIENAIKYTPEKGRIRISSKEQDDQVFFYVEDTGPGISQSEQALIFEKFYRGSSQHNTSKGTGLGLYLVKYFIELHKGQIYLQSYPGLGTKIGFSLPLQEDESIISPPVESL